MTTYDTLTSHLEDADTGPHPTGHILMALAGLIDIVETLEERIAALEVKPEPLGTETAILRGTAESRRKWWASLELEAEL